MEKLIRFLIDLAIFVSMLCNLLWIFLGFDRKKLLWLQLPVIILVLIGFGYLAEKGDREALFILWFALALFIVGWIVRVAKKEKTKKI